LTIGNPNNVMQPEISPRCSSCGVAVRERAMFCPECGKPFAQAANLTEPPAAVETSEPALESSAEPVVQEAQISKSAVEPGVAADPEMRAKETRGPSESDAPHGARERTRERLHRASSVARGALEDNVKRVEKIHHVSSAIYEEAHYDPSLRFVLVALGLFIVFIVLLILSKVMG
jgi:predicted  nucleic acid-binding Zn-ribbon protein